MPEGLQQSNQNGEEKLSRMKNENIRDKLGVYRKDKKERNERNTDSKKINPQKFPVEIKGSLLQQRLNKVKSLKKQSIDSGELK